MAGKSTKKTSKTKTETKATAQTKSAAPATTMASAQATAPAESKVTPITQQSVPAHSGAPVAMMEEVRTTVIKLADQEIIEEIRVRAYTFFEERGRHEGFDREDWARAEAEILAKYQREKSA